MFRMGRIDSAVSRLGNCMFITSILLLASVAFADPPTDGLIAYYPFSGNANDESGNNHHGTVHGAGLTTDRCENTDSAYTFDGIDDYIGVPYHGDFNLTDAITIAAWVKRSSVDRQDSILAKSGSQPEGTINYEFGIFIGRDSPSAYVLTFHFVNGTTWGAYAESVEEIVDTNWHHVAATYDRQSICLYIDGILDSSKPVTIAMVATANEPVSIGEKCSSWPFDYLLGNIDEICIYNRALSATEILQVKGEDPTPTPTPADTTPPVLTVPPDTEVEYGESTDPSNTGSGVSDRRL